MKIAFSKTNGNKFEEAIQREWLETNGLGGWASSTIVGANTRRYHGLLVAATRPPVGRTVLLAKLDETIEINGERFALGCNQYPGAVHPHGYEFLESFERDVFPVFEYQAGPVRIRKTVAAINGENSTLILYEVLQAREAFSFELQPLVAGRGFHSLGHANPFINRTADFENCVLRIATYDGVPDLFISAPDSTFEVRPDWYHRFEYRVERFRGLDYQEDLFTHGKIQLRLNKDDRIGVIIATTDPEGRDAFKLFQQEKRRRTKLLARLQPADAITKSLVLAADQFIVKRGEDLRTIIAGYHWFADWGRDTMIALPGICLVTGRFKDARKILRAFAQSMSQGMLPNRFPDFGEEPEYNTVDATLWYFVAIYKYLEYVERKPSRLSKPGRLEKLTSDEAFVRDELMPVLREILDWHERGTRYHIRVDDDGLLNAGEPGVQLTWMDAKIGNWVVTPRQVKAVEINALWFNALMIFSQLCKSFGSDKDAQIFAAKAKNVKSRFLEVFWNEQQGYLYDYVDGHHRDSALRPNQIFAISLPFPLLTGKKARQVLKAVEEKLYTPVGLRSLAPDDPSYRSHYGGDPLSRDSAYHQGTVWSWLLGPFLTAVVKVEGAAGKKRAQRLFTQIRPHLFEAAVGTISEIFDADQPHKPRGCIAQAWGVGELLRTYFEDIISEPTKQTKPNRTRRHEHVEA